MVATGWRHLGKGIVTSALIAMCFAALLNVPIYFFGRWITPFVGPEVARLIGALPIIALAILGACLLVCLIKQWVKPPKATDARSPPTVKDLLMERAPPWNRVAPIVIDTILKGITDKGLLEAFVLRSMNAGLVARYEALGREDADPKFIRAAISHFLCQTGNRAIASAVEAQEANQTDAATTALMVAIDTFEAAVTLAKNQIVGYIGMAQVYGLVGKRLQCHDWAKRGLTELEKMRREFAELGIQPFQGSDLIPPDALDQMERQLRSCLENEPDDELLANRSLSNRSGHGPAAKTG
jgi:hypothetical protein